jgi:hypothetical protein
MMLRSLFLVAVFMCLASIGADARFLGPGGVANGAGPSGGGAPPAPPQAVAAGLTTNALNSDFTQVQPANWLGGCATPGNGAALSPQFFDDGVPHSWWMNLWWSATYQGCSVAQIADPVYGGTTLDMPWTVDNTYNSVGTSLESASWDYSATGGVSHDYPPSSYYEITFRQSPAAAGNYAVLNTWGPQGISPTTWPSSGYQQTIEWDVMEPDAGQLYLSDAAVHNWGAGGSALMWVGFGPPGLPIGYDPTQYHTFGMLVTSDGTSMQGCSYIDNVFVVCAPLPTGLSPYEAANGRNFLVLQNACDYWNQPSGTCTQGQVQHLYVKTVRVWSCSSWQTTQCNGTIYPPPPPPPCGPFGNILPGGNGMTSSWTADATTLTTGQANDPCSGATTVKLVENTSNAQHGAYLTGLTLDANTTYTCDFYIKSLGSGSTRYFMLYLDDNAFTSEVINSFSPIDGSGGFSHATSPATISSTNSALIGSGWYRVGYTFNMNGNPGQFLEGYLSTSNTSSAGISYTGDGVSGLQLWGPSCRVGSSP